MCIKDKLSPLLGLRWPTMRARILSLTLSFHANLLDCTSTSLSSTILCYALHSGKEEVSLVLQCWFLEEPYESKFTDAILQGQSSLSFVKKYLIKADQCWQSDLSSEHICLKHLVSLMEVPWCKIGDLTLDHGYNATQCATTVFSFLSWPLFGDCQCYICDQPQFEHNYFSESSVSGTWYSHLLNARTLTISIDSFFWHWFQVSLFTCIIVC